MHARMRPRASQLPRLMTLAWLAIGRRRCPALRGPRTDMRSRHAMRQPSAARRRRPVPLHLPARRSRPPTFAHTRPDPTTLDAIDGKWRLLYTSRPGSASPIQRTFTGRTPRLQQQQARRLSPKRRGHPSAWRWQNTFHRAALSRSYAVSASPPTVHFQIRRRQAWRRSRSTRRWI
jgi:hypothetical protein